MGRNRRPGHSRAGHGNSIPTFIPGRSKEWVNPSSVFSPAQKCLRVPGARAVSRAGRRLRGEVLEPRQLLAVAWWRGRSGRGGPGAWMPAETPCRRRCWWCGARIRRRPLASWPRTRTIRHGPSRNIADADAVVGSGFLWTERERGGLDRRRLRSCSAVSLVNLSSGLVDLQATQFAYDPTLRKLTLTLSQPLAAGTYELRLDGSKIRNPAGQLLLGGRDGLSFAIPAFAAPDHTSGRRRRTEGGRLLRCRRWRTGTTMAWPT